MEPWGVPRRHSVPQLASTLICSLGLSLPAVEEEGWHGCAGVGLLFPAIVGEAEVDDTRLTIDGGSLFEDPGNGFAVFADLHHGRWSILGEASWIELDIANDSTELELSQLTAEVALGWRIPLSRGWIEPLAGARGWDLTLDLDDEGHSESWLEPLLGIRCEVPLRGSLAALARVDAGGFGVGADMTWRFEVGMRGRPLPWLDIQVSYRQLDTDYGSDDFAYNATMHSLLLGIGMNF